VYIGGTKYVLVLVLVLVLLRDSLEERELRRSTILPSHMYDEYLLTHYILSLSLLCYVVAESKEEYSECRYVHSLYRVYTTMYDDYHLLYLYSLSYKRESNDRMVVHTLY
jgi:hypothetical protein